MDMPVWEKGTFLLTGSIHGEALKKPGGVKDVPAYGRVKLDHL